MTLKHYKQAIKDFVVYNPTPQNWRLYKVLNNTDIKLKRLLKDMVREDLITITFKEDRGKVLRIIENKYDIYNEPDETK
jgi:ATP-dependent helicase YprA (DUF1998 family)